ncbi:sensor histidine kinase [Nonomuraea gerenzanensis]|uniref:histidine kinase n=1 Tax=Nonomuraea gerenzanensis TaxID=93944 RepID=A0A1M4EMK6_9ACTN|nr:ATP-binding protein [Nonomuraea gerenzanensis]UBU11571.1 histidine kinase [Nonomuraea gerenzanensis]SBP00067.1 two-component system sensor kinase [Nonomuraea gerenzanensis]
MTSAPQANEARRAQAFLVLAMVAFMLLDLALYRNVQRTSGPLGPAAGLVLSLVVDACLPFLGRFPRTVALVACAATVVAAVGDMLALGTFTPAEQITPVTAPPCTPVIVWFLVHRLPRPKALAYVTVLAVSAIRPWVPDWETVYAGLTTTILPAVLGLYIRARRELVESLRDRAESAEREQRLLAERAKAGERQRLAGEMHDIVTHHVTEIVLAAGALKVSTADHAVQSAAEHIRDAGTRTLTELRDLIGILRHGRRHEPERSTHVTLTTSDLETLVNGAVAAGNPTTLRVTGRPGVVTPAIARAAYRVLQEALTNARKHAPGTPVEVEVAYDHHTMTVTISNTSPVITSELAASGSGMGLDGLRSRVTLLGGAFTATPDPDGGFRVAATLPASVPTETDVPMESEHRTPRGQDVPDGRHGR